MLRGPHPTTCPGPVVAATVMSLLPWKLQAAPPEPPPLLPVSRRCLGTIPPPPAARWAPSAGGLAVGTAIKTGTGTWVFSYPLDYN